MNMKSTSLVAAAALGLLAGQTSFAQEAWSLAKEADGIKVYVREVPDSSLREFRGEVQLKTSTDRVVQTLKDASAFKKWMPDVVVSDLLRSTSTEQYHYLENKAPWPVSPRDGAYHFTYSRTSEANREVITVRVEAVPNYVPQRKGRVRIPKADGHWKLVPTADGVSVSYQIHASPGGAIPEWLANRAAVETPFDTLKALRSYLQAAN
ncbi:START domain-containing protein [Variovorax atrisoli]|uniref:START domain-containing protein n=1 Tax=Variovorax atrisoli TaxID=3394203 RepID=UPI0003685B37|nr:START domain-containing protein [Variovorax paradoxus]